MEEIAGKERAAFVAGITIAVRETLDSVIFLADEYSIDRDNAVGYFADIFKVMADTSTFKDWGGDDD